MPTSESARVWLVTGSSSGFGRAIVEAAVAAGDVAVATARRPDALAELVAAHPDQVEAVALDVTDTAAVTAVVDDVQATGPGYALSDSSSGGVGTASRGDSAGVSSPTR